MTASFGEILPLYHEHCPRVNTQLIEGDTKTLSDMLMHNEVDLIYTLDDMGYDAQRVKLFECPQDIVIVASWQTSWTSRSCSCRSPTATATSSMWSWRTRS